MGPASGGELTEESGRPAGLAALVDRYGPGEKVVFEGTHRTRTLDDTIDRWRDQLARFGITRLADVTTLDVIGIPVVQAVRPNASSLSVSQGKGSTRAAAEVSAFMEAAELWHAERHVLPMVRASVRESGQRRTLDPNRLPRRSGGSVDRDHRLLWVPGVDLTTGEELWVPEVVVSMDFTPPSDPLVDVMAVSSNGLASGNHLLEAAAHALYEAIERDAWSLEVAAREAGREPRVIDLETIDDPVTLGLLDRCRAAGCVVQLVDLTGDVGLAAIAASVVDEERNPFRPMALAAGAGCHPDRAVAASRAVTEAVQTRLTVIAGARDDITADVLTDRRTSKEAADHQREVVATRGTVDFASIPTVRLRTVADDVALALHRLAAVGLDQAVMIDLTRDEIGLPVVRVLVPGLDDRSGAHGVDRLGERSRTMAGREG